VTVTSSSGSTARLFGGISVGARVTVVSGLERR
jgi:hypothetical protein